jgi:hypothetical protein
MSSNDFSATFTVTASPDEAFAAINNVRGWWSEEIDGPTDNVGDEFTFWYEDIHRSTQRITESVPGRRVVWHIVQGYLNFTDDPGEWTGTDVVFDLSSTGEGTEVRFSHVGLLPQSECYDQCSTAWSFFFNQSLRDLIVTGQGQPNKKTADV